MNGFTSASSTVARNQEGNNPWGGSFFVMVVTYPTSGPAAVRTRPHAQSPFPTARAAMGITTAAFFALLGAVLIACGWLVLHGRAGARSPIIVAQVLFLGLAWSFRGGSTTWVAIGLAIVAVVVLAGLLHPASIDALTESDPHDG